MGQRAMTAEATNLDEVRADLYRIFNKAVKDQLDYEKYSYATATGNRQAISDLARAIASVEREQREAKERGYIRLDKKG